MFGLSAMEIFDLTVDALTTVGLAVILNNHMSDAAWCCSDTDRNGLWHNQKYSSDSWVEAVISVAMRYE
jgi:endoglucanase